MRTICPISHIRSRYQLSLVVSPIIYGDSYISGGAGFLPSTPGKKKSYVSISPQTSAWETKKSLPVNKASFHNMKIKSKSLQLRGFTSPKGI